METELDDLYVPPLPWIFVQPEMSNNLTVYKEPHGFILHIHSSISYIIMTYKLVMFFTTRPGPSCKGVWLTGVS